MRCGFRNSGASCLRVKWAREKHKGKTSLLEKEPPMTSEGVTYPGGETAMERQNRGYSGVRGAEVSGSPEF